MKFQDGTPLNAAAVQFTIERNLAAKSIAFPPEFADISSVDTDGNLGLTLHLSGPDAGAVYPDLAGLETMPVSPTAVARNDPNPITNPLGAGPFRVKQYVPDQSLLLTKNSTYWNAKDIKLGGIEFVQATAGTPAAINQLKAGTVDVITSDPTQLDALKGGGIENDRQQPHIEAVLPSLHHPIAARQRQGAPGTQLRLEQDRHQQGPGRRKGRTGIGTGSVDEQPVPRNLTNSYAYNPTKAKQLLAEAGYAKGLT